MENDLQIYHIEHILFLFYFRYDERDVFMSREHFHELSVRLSGSHCPVLPLVFLHGQLLGVRQLIAPL